MSIESKKRSFAGRRQKVSHRLKSTLNSKVIHASCIQGVGDRVIDFCARKGENDRVIAGRNVLLKIGSSVSPNDRTIGIDMCLSEEHSNWFWGIIWNRQFDSTQSNTLNILNLRRWNFEQPLLSNGGLDNEDS